MPRRAWASRRWVNISAATLRPTLSLPSSLHSLPARQVGADAVVRSLACKALQIAGLAAAPPTAAAAGSTSPLMGTPAEPYANPRHPSARPDDSSNILAGNPLEEYANPSPAWRGAAAAAAQALDEADRLLPPRAPSSSGTGGSSGGGGSGGGGSSLRAQPAAAQATAAAAAGSGGATTGLGPSPRVQPILRRLRRFMEEHVYPAGALPARACAMRAPLYCCVCSSCPQDALLNCSVRREGPSRLWPAQCPLPPVPAPLHPSPRCCPAPSPPLLPSPLPAPRRGHPECARGHGPAVDHPPGAGAAQGGGPAAGAVEPVAARGCASGVARAAPCRRPRMQTALYCNCVLSSAEPACLLHSLSAAPLHSSPSVRPGLQSPAGLPLPLCGYHSLSSCALPPRPAAAPGTVHA